MTVTTPWPPELQPIFECAITCEYASLTKVGAPVTIPCVPYIGNAVNGGRTLDVSTGLTYPTKAERARRNPKVALLFSDPVGSGLAAPPVVLVVGDAAVRDCDLQTNTDRYIHESFRKTPYATRGFPRFMASQLAFYFARIWIEITPQRMLWWPKGEMESEPQRWDAPAGITVSSSDPEPQGKAPSAWKAPPADWRPVAATAIQRLGMPVLTWVGSDGYPLLARARSATFEDDQFSLELPRGLSNLTGAACLTFHAHPEKLTGQENHTFMGQVKTQSGRAVVQIERQLADWSLGGPTGQGIGLLTSFFGPSFKLRSRLKSEAARRGQPVPKIHFP